MKSCFRGLHIHRYDEIYVIYPKHVPHSHTCPPPQVTCEDGEATKEPAESAIVNVSASKHETLIFEQFQCVIWVL